MALAALRSGLSSPGPAPGERSRVLELQTVKEILAEAFGSSPASLSSYSG